MLNLTLISQISLRFLTNSLEIRYYRRAESNFVIMRNLSFFHNRKYSNKHTEINVVLIRRQYCKWFNMFYSNTQLCINPSLTWTFCWLARGSFHVVSSAVFPIIGRCRVVTLAMPLFFALTTAYCTWWPCSPHWPMTIDCNTYMIRLDLFRITCTIKI